MDVNMKKIIPVFFSSDERYLPYLSVTIESIKRNMSKNFEYEVKVLCSDFSDEGRKNLKKMQCNGLKIEVVSLEEKIKDKREQLSLRLRDYYSEAIFYRLFIPSLFPDLDKAIYIDCDTVLNTDIAELYLTELGENIIGAVSDESIPSVPEFCDYVKNYLGVEVPDYINSGVLVMNLDAFRKERIEEKFLKILASKNPDTVAPDQDYLNVLCKGKIHHLPHVWNKQPKPESLIPASETKLIHYNMFNKPWHYKGIPYEKEFWDYAKTSKYYGELLRDFASYTEEQRAADIEGAKKLAAHAALLAEEKTTFFELVNDGVNAI